MKKAKKQLNFIQALIPMVGMILLMFVGLKFLKIDKKLILIIAACFASCVAVWAGYSWSDIIDSIGEKVKKVLPALLILLTIGIVIATWMASGTLPMIIYYGLKIISPKFLAITAFLVTCILSICTGTSWGSVGTIGIVLIAIAEAQGANMGMIAGAIVSGAYFGDKLSPLSDTTNIAPVAAGSELYEHIKHMLWTTIPGFIVCVVVYSIAGGMFATGNAGANTEIINTYLNTIDSLYNFNILLITPIFVILLGAYMKKPTIPAMISAAALAIILAVIFQPIELRDALNASISGFDINMLKVEGVDYEAATALVGKLINRGGLNSMVGTFVVALCAMCFAGAISVTDSMRVVVSTMLKRVKSTGSLVLTTLIAGVSTEAILANVQIAMFMTGEMFSEEYKRKGLAAKNLSRSIEDSITMTANMIPWTGAALYMSSTLDVPVSQYAPWNILCWSGIIFATIWGFTGIGIAKLEATESKSSMKGQSISK